MNQQQYKCTLLTNLVLSSKAATEGFAESLDYIPGAKFLGLIASEKYYSVAQGRGEAMDFFHNGTVRFGDAFPLIKEKIAYKKPYSWLHPKKAELSAIYVDAATPRSFRENLVEQEGIKLEQAKKGYFTQQYSWKIEQDFAIKSAYNAQTLRSKEGAMYGYFSLPRGSAWTFSIASDNPDYLKTIHSMLIGKKRIGRSKTAEYGMVKIEALKEGFSTQTFIPNRGYAYLYAASNLCFYDAYGNNCPYPTDSDLGLMGKATIAWDKSQIRHRMYTTWNQKRNNRNADRLIIERGSVIAVQLNGQGLDQELFNLGIGVHRSEGFGKVLVNPWFLNDAQPALPTQLEKYQLKPSTNIYGQANDESDEAIISFVKRRKKTAKRLLDIDKLVNIFRAEHGSKFTGISPSQWGQLRRYAKNLSVSNYKKLIFDESVGFTYRGRMENTWRKYQRRELLEEYVFGTEKNKEKERLKATVPEGSELEFIMKLAAQMAKNSDKNS